MFIENARIKKKYTKWRLSKVLRTAILLKVSELCQSPISFKSNRENSVFIKAAITTIIMTTDRNCLIIHGL